MGGQPRDLVLRRLLRLLALARGTGCDRLRRGDRLRRMGRTRSLACVLRADAVPARRGRRDVRGAGPPPLLRLLRGDVDPALRPRRRVGRGASAGRNRDVRHLHDGGVAAHARFGRGVRRDAGDVLADGVGDERQRVDLPRLRDRVRGQGSALPVPRLAAAHVPAGAGRSGRGALRSRLEDGDLRLPEDRIAEVPGAGGRSLRAHPRPRERRSHLRIGARLPLGRPARRGRVLVDGADGAHHARRLRVRRPRARRRHPPVGGARPRLGEHVPPRRDGRAALRDRRARRARRDGQGPTDARNRRARRRDDRPRRARIRDVRRGIPDHGRRLRPGVGLRGRGRAGSRARGDVHPARDLGDPAREAGRGRA